MENTARKKINVPGWMLRFCFLGFLVLLFFLHPVRTEAAVNGPLHVSGTQLCDAGGNAVQLRGVSTHGINWFPQYVNEDAFRTLRDDWGANLVRLAMYTEEYNGYCAGGDRTSLEAVIDRGVKAANDLGMYVIVDWHILSDGNPTRHQSEAVDFFSRMSKKYSAYDNVLYEICNEPNNVDWNSVRRYANAVIPAIRANDTDAVILVGTTTWSQDVDAVIGSQVDNPHNVMYTLHFYAGTHRQPIRDKAEKAIRAGIPVFVSEFSICDASGNGAIDYAEAENWKNFINQHGLSYAGWSLSNKAETSALISSSCGKTSGWKEGELSDTGRWLRSMIRASGASSADKEQVTAFVTRLYRNVLGRKPDGAGLQDWTGRLLSHSITGADTVRGFVYSREFTNMHLSDGDYVTAMYRTLLGREPDPAGYADWVGRLGKGQKRSAIVDGFVWSQEFGNLCRKYGILRG